MSSITTFNSQLLFVIILLEFFLNAVCARVIAKTFYLHTQEGNPNAAWEVCASYGATMVKIRSGREHDALVNMVSAEPTFVGSFYWIGLFLTYNNQFSWGCSDQLKRNHSHWGDDQLAVNGSLQCVEVRTDRLWYSASCHNSYKFICQKKTGSCAYVQDVSFVTFNVTSRLAKKTVNTVSECHNMCENFNSGKSCFYVLLRSSGECTLFKSKPAIISGSGEYFGYSRKCYSVELRTDQVPIVASSTEPPARGCIAPPLTLTNQPTVASRDQTTVASPDEATTTSSDITTAFADKTTLSFPDETKVASADETMATSTDKTTIASSDKITAPPSDETTTLPDRTTVVPPDKTTVVSLDETTVLSLDETTVKENEPLLDFTTTGAQRTANDDTSVTRIQTSTHSETTLQYSGTQSERTSANRNTAALTKVDRSSTATPSTKLVNLMNRDVTITSQDSTLTSTIPNVLSAVENSTPAMPTVRTSSTMKTPPVFSKSQSAKPNFVSSLAAAIITREVKTSETPELSTANLTITVPDISLKNTHSIFVPLPETAQNNCYCPCAMSYSAEEMEQFIQMILDGLSMDRKIISAYVRTLTSAPDPRPSARAVGCTGLTILLFSIVSIMLLDLKTLFRDFFSIKESIKTMFRGKSKGLNN